MRANCLQRTVYRVNRLGCWKTFSYSKHTYQQRVITDVLEKIKPLGDEKVGKMERKYDVEVYKKKDTSHKRKAKVKKFNVEYSTGESVFSKPIENIVAMPEGTVSKELMTSVKEGRILPQQLKENIIFEHTPDGFVDIYDKTDPHFWSTTLKLMKDSGDVLEEEIEQLKKQDTTTSDHWFRTYHLPRTLIQFTRLLTILGLQGKKQQAMDTFEEMKKTYNIRPDSQAYTAVMHACAGKGDYDSCKRYLEEMIHTRVVPNVENYGTLVRAYCQARKLDEALQVIEMMREHDIETNVVIHSIFLKGLIQSKEYTRAWKHFQFMQTRYAVMPDTICYTMMMDCAANAGNVEKAISMFDQFEPRQLFPTRYTYNVLIKACSRRSSHLEEAFKYADQMEAMGFQPSVHTLNSLIYAASQQKDPNKAFKVLKKMRSQYNIHPNAYTYSVLMLAFANNQAMSTADHNHNISEVEKLLKQVEERPDIPMRTHFINLYLLVHAKAFRVHESIHIFNTLFKEKNLEPDQYSYQALIIMFAQLNRPARAVELLDQMVSIGLTPLYSSYYSVVRSYIQEGEHDLAFAMIRRMKKEGDYMLSPQDIRKVQKELLETTNKFKELQVQKSDRGLLELDIEDDELD